MNSLLTRVSVTITHSIPGPERPEQRIDNPCVIGDTYIAYVPHGGFVIHAGYSYSVQIQLVVTFSPLHTLFNICFPEPQHTGGC